MIMAQLRYVDAEIVRATMAQDELDAQRHISLRHSYGRIPGGGS